MYTKIINEKNEDLSVWEGNPESLVRTVYERDDSPFLKGIGLYEDTYFNSSQIRTVKQELLNLLDVLDSKDAKSDISSLLAYIDKIEMGEYVVFVGD